MFKIEKTPIGLLKHRVKVMLLMLSIMFLLGMAVNLIGVKKDDLASVWSAGAIFTYLHILLALGLLINSLLAVKFAVAAKKLVRAAWIGVVLIVATTVCGMLTLGLDSDWWSFAMATGFIASVWLYGIMLFRAKAVK